MSDMFHEAIPESYVARVFAVMEQASWHQFQVLAKRHERLAELAPRLPWPDNVWIGVSVENNRWTLRADYLRQVRAAVRFISAETLLGPFGAGAEVRLRGQDAQGGGSSGHWGAPGGVGLVAQSS